MLSNTPMTNEEVRHANLLLLINEFGLKNLAELLNHGSTSTLSQLKNRSKDSKTKKPRGVGTPLARRLEKLCKKTEGWMDADHSHYPLQQTGLIAASQQNTEPSKWEANSQEERDLLEGFRAASLERREDMLDMARKSIKTDVVAA